MYTSVNVSFLYCATVCSLTCQNGGTLDLSVCESCDCLPGYTNYDCGEDIDECEGTNSCQNGGACVNTEGSYYCMCTPGYTGALCENDIDECVKYMPCVYGTCMNSFGSFSCLCVAGYTGQLCDEDCEGANLCQNCGTCLNTEGSYDCVCAPGFTG